MRIATYLRRSARAGITAALIGGLGGPVVARPAPVRHHPAGTVGVAPLPPGTQRPTNEVLLSIGEGQLVTLPAAASNVWVSNPEVADVYVSNPRQVHLFGKGFGEATVFATGANGAVIYSAAVHVSQNITSIDKMLRAAMPDAQIKVITAGQMAVLTGTVASPEDAATAKQLVTAFLNPGVDLSSPTAALKVGIVSRLKMATPLQVNLQVRIAEVSRSFMKNVGVNLTNRASGNTMFAVSQGRQGTITTVPGIPPAGYVNGAPVNAAGLPVILDPTSGQVPGSTLFSQPAALAGGALLGLAGHALGADLLGSLDLGETIGQVTTLATPNLTALSGETATFLAGGEIPIPVSQGLGAVSVEYKQYGVSLAYTPTVLSDGRISLRVRPEVSELSSAGAVTISGTTIPALTTRRTETTVELGSGQSLVIGGLLSNNHNNSFTKTPGVGDLPILGALFRSNAFQRNETELVIVVTPYLVKPVNANDIVLPTDGYKAPTDADRILLDQLTRGTTGGQRPKPTLAPPPTSAAPSPIGAVAPATVPLAGRSDPKTKSDAVAPGFSSN